MQKGYVFKHGRNWYLRYRDNFEVDGKIVRKQTCVMLAKYDANRYRTESDLADLAAEKLAGVRQASKCPHSADSFTSYVEDEYLPYVLRSMKASTYSGYRTYWERYLRPRVGKYALRDFTVAIVAALLKDIACKHKLNTETVKKIRSILSGVFTYAMSAGDFPARSEMDNPASRARIPETANEPKRTLAASRETVQAILTALQGHELERTAVAIIAYTGVRPGEARGLRWEDWDRTRQQIEVKRSVWHTIVGTPKTEQSEKPVPVNPELRQILLDLSRSQGLPVNGYILAGHKGQPMNLDNLAKRTIRTVLEAKGLIFPGWYTLRRFFATEVRLHTDSETVSKALRNSKAVADKHYIKPTEVLPDVRKAVNDAVSGLVN